MISPFHSFQTEAYKTPSPMLFLNYQEACVESASITLAKKGLHSQISARTHPLHVSKIFDNIFIIRSSNFFSRYSSVLLFTQPQVVPLLLLTKTVKNGVNWFKAKIKYKYSMNFRNVADYSN